MPLLENAFCPVCNRKFEEGDDVVYCPECGTPHHRDCYKAVGHCVNRGLHTAGYSYYDEMKASQPAQNSESAEKPQQPFHNTKDEAAENEAQFNPFIIPSPAQFESTYEKDSQTIDGESVADFAAAVRTNIPRFINIFKEFEDKKRKTSWNWGAFFFGSLYLFFRKMYKQAVAFFCSFIAVVYASAFALMKFAPKYIEAAKNFADLYSQNKLTNEDIITFSNSPDMGKANIIVYATLGIILILRIIQALLADKFYKATISQLIKNVNSQLKDGASFIQTPVFPTQSIDMNQKQMRLYYLARRGGTTFFLPMTAMFAGYLLISMSYSIFY